MGRVSAQGKGLPDNDPGATTQTDTGDTGSLKGDAGVEGELAGESDRENIKPPPGTATARVQLTGRLVRSDGAPGAGLTLRYTSLAGSPRLANMPNFSDAPAVKTDADGRFHVDAKVESTGYLGLAGPEAVFKHGTGRGMVVQVGKESKDLGDVLILTPARVSGQVVDTTGQPVAGVSVSSNQGGTNLWGLAIGQGKKTTRMVASTWLVCVQARASC